MRWGQARASRGVMGVDTRMIAGVRACLVLIPDRSSPTISAKLALCRFPAVTTGHGVAHVGCVIGELRGRACNASDAGDVPIVGNVQPAVSPQRCAGLRVSSGLPPNPNALALGGRRGQSAHSFELTGQQPVRRVTPSCLHHSAPPAESRPAPMPEPRSEGRISSCSACPVGGVRSVRGSQPRSQR